MSLKAYWSFLMTYQQYIASAAWQLGASRLEELRLSGFRCRTCNRGRDAIELQVHHRTYERMGHELVSDLTTLCVECHRVITCLIRGRRYASRPLSMAPDYQPALVATRPLSDLLLRGGRA
jgi:HNH endonuclease